MQLGQSVSTFVSTKLDDRQDAATALKLTLCIYIPGNMYSLATLHAVQLQILEMSTCDYINPWYMYTLTLALIYMYLIISMAL